MIRLFVTGDEHIGLKYAGHEKPDQIARCRISAFENMVTAANDENCDLFVITGDLFENHSVSKAAVQSVTKILSNFNGVVAVLPGNHDYYSKNSKVWKSFINEIKDYDNIMLMTEYRPYTLSGFDENIVLYPALCTSLHSKPGENNLGWIKDEAITPDSAYRIGIAHGSVEGETIDREGEYFRMSRAELESIPVDVWLIGHTHVPFPKDLTCEFKKTERILNAGTHVQTKVNCNTEGLCFIVEIDDDKTVRAKKFVSGNIRFIRRTIEVSNGNIKETLNRELGAYPDESVVEITLTGAVDDKEYSERESIANECLSRFIEGTSNDSELSRLITKELIDSQFAETSFSAQFLSELLQEPKEAQLVYDLMNSLKKE